MWTQISRKNPTKAAYPAGNRFFFDCLEAIAVLWNRRKRSNSIIDMQIQLAKFNPRLVAIVKQAP